MYLKSNHQSKRGKIKYKNVDGKRIPRRIWVQILIPLLLRKKILPHQLPFYLIEDDKSPKRPKKKGTGKSTL